MTQKNLRNYSEDRLFALVFEKSQKQDICTVHAAVAYITNHMILQLNLYLPLQIRFQATDLQV